MKNLTQTDWFESWFDTSYYHILYKNRDDKEAHFFMNNIVEKYSIASDARILDLACGKGRHSIYLNQKGFEVTGLDLSEENIKHAEQFENERLSFFSHDMRKPFRTNYFDYIFNVFTSFGYFENEKDDISTLQNVKKGLREKGTFIFDFLNAHKVIHNLVPKEQKVIDGVQFDITKFVENGFIVKQIEIKDKDYKGTFQERVKALTYEDFKRLFAIVGLEIQAVYGNYKLEAYEVTTSDRLILIAK